MLADCAIFTNAEPINTILRYLITSFIISLLAPINVISWQVSCRVYHNRKQQDGGDKVALNSIDGVLIFLPMARDITDAEPTPISVAAPLFSSVNEYDTFTAVIASESTICPTNTASIKL